MDRDTRRGRRLMAAGGLVIIAITAALAPASTVARDTDIIRTGSCSGASDWKLKLSEEDGRIEVEFEVDQNVVGQTWNVRLKRDGDVFWRGQRTTQPPSGSFEVRRLTADGPGSELIVGRARNPLTDEVCRGSATFTG